MDAECQKYKLGTKRKKKKKSLNAKQSLPEAPQEGGMRSETDKPLRKHAYSNILKVSPSKTESFQIKILIFFIFLLKT